jgi:DNA-binding transcriptional LysR family regulator
MDLKKCEVFVQAIDTGSFSKAAEKSGYTPSGVAHMMNALEDEIGFPLLVRGHRGVMATETGKKLLPTLRELLRWNEQFRQTASEINGLETGTVMIGSYSSIATHWCPRLSKRSVRSIRILKST